MSQNGSSGMLKVDDINRSRFIKADDLFKENKIFILVGYQGMKQTVINNRDATVSEFDIKIMGDDEIYTLTLGYNKRHDNIRDYFAENPTGTSEAMKLGKLETGKGNPAWIFTKAELVPDEGGNKPF